MSECCRSPVECAVHPHGRGDNRVAAVCRRTCNGSPPRAWGQSRVLRVRGSSARFTPTGVGTISKRPYRMDGAAVHPHGRGDNNSPLIFRLSRCGSPPRAWGQCDEGAERRAKVRFTPTGVGTIIIRSIPSVASTVHPHGRGDNLCISSFALSQHGSPPRAWGQ